MKINDINSFNINYTNNAGKIKHMENQPKPGKFDVVLINKAKEIDEKRGNSVDEIKARITAQLEAPSDKDKVNEIAMSVESGEYEINSTELARILLNI